ncbi:MAG TPA: DinB family protein [Puia sp.]|jgi:hypothetical protein
MQQAQQIVDQLISQWETTFIQATKQFDQLASFAWDQPVTPGRNKVNYLVGHLVTAADKVIEAMELGPRLYPELDIMFFEAQSDSAVYPPYDELREKWIRVNEYLLEKWKGMAAGDWLTRHHYISDADFRHQPHRNKLAIFITRFAHLCVHMGQLRLIKQPVD